MAKKDHDDIAANQFRTVNYQKKWHLQGLNILKTFEMKNFSMLDLGCGNGEFSEMVRDNFNADITCLDYAESHLERVKGLGFKTIKCDFDSNQHVERLNNTFKNSFDLIVSFEVIEHIFDVDVFLSTAHNLLKDNGILIISTPNNSYISYRIYSIFRGNIPVSEGHHVRFFNHRRLQQTLLLNGFDIVYDYSLGKGDYYLDRAIGERKLSFRTFCVYTIFMLWSLFIPKSSMSYFSNLLFVTKKINAIPIGLDPTFRNITYEKLSKEEKKTIIKRLMPMRKEKFFDEHPGLRKFIDEEMKLLSEDVCK